MKISLFTLAMVLVFAASVFAGPSVTFQGTMVDELGNPMQGATLLLERYFGNILVQSTTVTVASNGSYAGTLPTTGGGGEYYVTAQVGSYAANYAGTFQRSGLVSGPFVDGATSEIIDVGNGDEALLEVHFKYRATCKLTISGTIADNDIETSTTDYTRSNKPFVNLFVEEYDGSSNLLNTASPSIDPSTGAYTYVAYRGCGTVKIKGYGVCPSHSVTYACTWGSPGQESTYSNTTASGSQSRNFVFRWSSLYATTLYNFDAGQNADHALYRPLPSASPTPVSNWYLHDAVYQVVPFGQPGDLMAPADYDGDSETDIAYFRPSTGTWSILQSFSNTVATVSVGQSGDIPVPSDVNGDGYAELRLYRPDDDGAGGSNASKWYWYNTSGTLLGSQFFGVSGDKPILGDFDADGTADLAVTRTGSSAMTWYVQTTLGGYFYSNFGVPGDKPAPGDYDGDGKTDHAVFRPSNNTWYISATYAGYSTPAFGASGDLPAPADYDNDGKIDIAVFRPNDGSGHGRFYIQGSTVGYTTYQFGVPGDLPIAGFNIN